MMMMWCVVRMTGGELFEYLASRQKVNEATATMFLRQVLDGVCHLHEKNIVHLDLKVSALTSRSMHRPQGQCFDLKVSVSTLSTSRSVLRPQRQCINLKVSDQPEGQWSTSRSMHWPQGQCIDLKVSTSTSRSVIDLKVSDRPQGQWSTSRSVHLLTAIDTYSHVTASPKHFTFWPNFLQKKTKFSVNFWRDFKNLDSKWALTWELYY